MAGGKPGKYITSRVFPSRVFPVVIAVFALGQLAAAAALYVLDGLLLAVMSSVGYLLNTRRVSRLLAFLAYLAFGAATAIRWIVE
jgi:hypothetical protein